MSSLHDLYKINGYPLKMAGDVMSRGFHDDPLLKYIFLNEDDRRQFLPYLFMGNIWYSLEFGEVYSTSSNLEGFALWLPSEFAHLTPGRIWQCGADPFFIRIGVDFLERLKITDQVIETHKQLITEPHMFLLVLCVDPKFQGKGFGKKLLEPMLKRLDDKSMNCFLDTNKRSNLTFYQRFGFEVIKEYELDDSKVMNWAMLRKPNS